MPSSKHIEPQKTPETKTKKKGAVATMMRGASEPAYSGPALPPLSPGERAEVEADMASVLSTVDFVLRR